MLSIVVFWKKRCVEQFETIRDYDGGDVSREVPCGHVEVDAIWQACFHAIVTWQIVRRLI